VTTTILLVDDEKLVREELGGILEDEGYGVVIAGDGDEGLEAFLTQRPDMVITDARMPRREGLSLAKAILAEDPQVPITMITGHGSETMAIEALRLGITDFIKKPVTISDLLAAIERMEGSRRITGGHADHAANLPSSARLVSHSHIYTIGNDVSELPVFVGAVVLEIAPGLERRRRDGLQLALREVMINAVEHGNLAISYQEKSEAIEAGSLEALVEARARHERFRDRKVRVETTCTPERIDIVVEDEGEGFDWRSLPDLTDPTNLLRAHGRGVLLAHLSVDSLTYNDRGNRVTLSTKLTDRDHEKQPV